MSTKAEYAISLHDQGYNCAQAVACTFCKEFGVDGLPKALALVWA